MAKIIIIASNSLKTMDQSILHYLYSTLAPKNDPTAFVILLLEPFAPYNNEILTKIQHFNCSTSNKVNIQKLIIMANVIIWMTC